MIEWPQGVEMGNEPVAGPHRMNCRCDDSGIPRTASSIVHYSRIYNMGGGSCIPGSLSPKWMIR